MAAEAAGGGAAEEAFAGALRSALSPAVEEVDRSVQGALESQIVLRSQLERLQRELERFAGAADVPSLVPYISKLASTRRRLVEVNAKISRVDRRLEGIRSLVRKKLLSGERQLPLHEPVAAAAPAGDRRMKSISDLLDWDAKK